SLRSARPGPTRSTLHASSRLFPRFRPGDPQHFSPRDPQLLDDDLHLLRRDRDYSQRADPLTDSSLDPPVTPFLRQDRDGPCRVGVVHHAPERQVLDPDPELAIQEKGPEWIPASGRVVVEDLTLVKHLEAFDRALLGPGIPGEEDERSGKEAGRNPVLCSHEVDPAAGGFGSTYVSMENRASSCGSPSRVISWRTVRFNPIGVTIRGSEPTRLRKSPIS